jgi:hypothetical protein
MSAVSNLVGIVAACAGATALEQFIAWALRRSLLTDTPPKGAAAPLARYERSLLTPHNSDVRWIRAGLVLAGLGTWLAQAWHPAAWTVAAAAWLMALAWDLWTWEGVTAGPERITWRRGLQRSPRSLRLAQVAEVYVVERPARGPWARLLRRIGLAEGSAYLALELHNGRAAKLPRTDRWLGVRSVRQVAGFLRIQQQIEAHSRRQALEDEHRARRRAPRILPDPVDLALRRELVALRKQQGQRWLTD